jgi:hypothetical protein
MATEVNKQNRPIIEQYTIEAFNQKSMQGKKKQFLSIIDIWNVEDDIQKKFNISDEASEEITSSVINWYKTLTEGKQI